MYLCERATQRAGVRVSWRWWYHKGIDWNTEKERVADALATDSELEAESEAEVEVEAELEEGGEDRSTSNGVSGSDGAE